MVLIDASDLHLCCKEIRPVKCRYDGTAVFYKTPAGQSCTPLSRWLPVQLAGDFHPRSPVLPFE